MPRVSRAKAVKKHGTAAQLHSKRGFAVPEDQVDEVIIPGQPEASSSTSQTAELGPSDVSFPKLKKGKSPASSRAEAPLSSHPYSRSHTRREKRKAKQNIAGGLGTISLALAEAVGETPAPPEPKSSRGGTAQTDKKPVMVNRPVEDEADKGKIGQGKKRTMNESGRRKQIALEAKRIPAVTQHPAFKANPWATIRLHASNSIATKPLPGNKTEKIGRSDRMDVE